jgi:hypothetical protein
MRLNTATEEHCKNVDKVDVGDILHRQLNSADNSVHYGTEFKDIDYVLHILK